MTLESYVVAAIVIAFNAGGFAWMARNHFRTVGRHVARHEKQLAHQSRCIYLIAGHLGVVLPPPPGEGK